MAHTADYRALTNFESSRVVSDHEVLYVAGDPGVTFTRGEQLAMSGGVCVLASDSSADTFGHVGKTTVCPAASVAFPIPGAGGGIGDLDGSGDGSGLTLIPCVMDIAAGVKVKLGTIANYKDEAAIASYATATRTIGLTTGLGTDDYGIGAFIYIYTGPGKGELNIIEDYDHADGNAALEVITHRDWNATLTTSTGVIMLTNAVAASDGRGFLGRFDLDDEDALDCGDGYNDGNYVLYGDFMKIGQYIQNYLAVPFINANAILTSP